LFLARLLLFLPPVLSLSWPTLSTHLLFGLPVPLFSSVLAECYFPNGYLVHSCNFNMIIVINAKFALEQTVKAQRESRGIRLLFL
jgi:hypothetical protein